MVLIDDRLTGELAHAHDAVSMVHSVLLDAIDGRIHFASRAVEICGVNVDAERFAAYHLGMNTGRVGKPVMSMNKVELFTSCQHACNN